MKIALFSAGIAISSILLACWIHCMIATAFRPEWLARLNSLSHPRWYATVYFVAVTITFGVMIYTGIYTLLWWMPSSWGSADEYGDYVSIRSYVAGIAAVVMALPVTGFWLNAAAKPRQ